MIYYVAHKYGGDPENFNRAKKITHDLQINDLDNCYICPLMAFSHLGYGELGIEEEMLICEDLLMACDVLLVASEPSKGVRREIALARKIGMEVQYLDDRL